MLTSKALQRDCSDGCERLFLGIGKMVSPGNHNTRPADSKVLRDKLYAHGFEEIRGFEALESLPIVRARDTKRQCDSLIVEILLSNPLDKTYFPRISPGRHSSVSEGYIIAPHQVLEVDARYFGVFSLPTGMTLRENIALMTELNEPFHEDEICRVGRAVCEAVSHAKAYDCVPLVHVDLITIGIDGSIHTLVVNHGLKLAHSMDKALTNAEKTVGSVLREMACADGSPDSRGTNLSPRLTKLLQLVADGGENASSWQDLRDALPQQRRSHHRWWTITRLGASTALLVAAAVLFQLHKSITLPGGSDTSETLRLATEDAKALAHASAKEWAILVSSERVTSPIQALDAEHMLGKGDELDATGSFDQARKAYHKAHVLYAAAIAASKEVVALRSEAENGRTLAKLSGSRWTPLVGSFYTQLPDSIEKAIDAAIEGDFRYVQRHYREAVIAYELAKQLYDAVPPEEFNKLMQHHLARTCRDQANVSAGTWERLEASIGATTSEMANQAKQRMAAAEGMLQAGQDTAAVQAFEEAMRLFDAATKSTVADMVARVATANARELAMGAARRWQSVSSAFENTSSPEDIAAAELLLEQAHGLARESKQEQARSNYERAAMLYEQQIEEANVQALARAQAYEHQASVMIESLKESQKALEERWKSARKRFEEVHVQLAAPADPDRHRQLLVESDAARQQYRRATMLRAYCDMNIYSGSVYDKAKSMLNQGREMMTRTEYVGASLILETAATEFARQNELVSALDNYLDREEKVSRARERTLAALGPVAQELPEIRRLLHLADENVASAKGLLETRDVMEAIQLLNDAGLTYSSILPQAEIELMDYARVADSEIRNEIALAALKELLEINPGHIAALELTRKLQSTAPPTNRVTLIQGILRINGKKLPASPTRDELSAIIGEPSRQRSGLSGLLYDELGMLATPDPETGRILNLVIYYAKPRYQNEPYGFYPGTVELEGFPIGRDVSIETINAGVKVMRFQPTQVGSAYQTTYMGLRLLISYHSETNQIYTISVMFLSAPRQ